MSTSPKSPRPPRRFRRRLLVVLLVAGLAPLLAWAYVMQDALDRFLSLSPAALEEILERVDGELERRGDDPALAAEVRAARLNLAQADLARRSVLRRAPALFAGAIAISAVLLAGAAVLIGRSVSAPIEELSAGMLRYERGELDHRIAERAAHARDELGVLVRQFNRMGDELAIQRQRLAITEGLAAWQDVARAMAHDLRNPLTAMKMALGRLARRPDGAAAGAEAAPALASSSSSTNAWRESLDLLAEEVAVLERMTESFAAFARLPRPSPQPLELRALVEEVCALYRDHAAVPITVESGDPVPLRGDPDQLRRAMGNLLKNALEASAASLGPVRVVVGSAGSRARVIISDEGTGITAPIDGTALTRSLASTKAGGSGLGLPIAHKIVHEHGGTLRLAPRPGRGTDATIELPA